MRVYLDNGATSLHKPPQVAKAMLRAMANCANPGRGGHPAAMEAARVVYTCRERAGKLFDCAPEQVVFTANCTHSLNLALRSLVRPGDRVVITGFEHNAVTRTLHTLGAKVCVAGRRLFDWEDTLRSWKTALAGADAAVFTAASNVFGYVLPVAELARLCREAGVPFVVDAAQGAGSMPLSLKELGAAFLAMPGHKGLLGPMGTGLLLCSRVPEPLLTGGTGSESRRQDMPDFLPDRAEAGTLNVPGIAGLSEGIGFLLRTGVERIGAAERIQAAQCARGLEKLGYRVFSGPHQGGTVSFVGKTDCEELAQRLGQRGIAVRAGLHCAPLAHESAGTLETGTVRVSFGADASLDQTRALLQTLRDLKLP